MALFQRENGVWYYTFYIGNRRYRKSTATKLRSKASKIEAVAFSHAKELGPHAVIVKAPTLAAFGVSRYLPWVDESRSLVSKSSRYYRRGWELLKLTSMMRMRIDQISTEIIDRAQLQGTTRADISGAYKNQALRTLSRALNLAAEWKLINRAPRVHLEPENEREEMITSAREKLLLQHAGLILSDVIMCAQDTGARPNEVFRIRVENIDWQQRSIFNPHGKSKNSKRHLPISDRVFEVLTRRVAGREEGWLFLSNSKCGHLTTVAGAFARARKKAGLPNTVVLYSARHTFGTDLLGETGNLAVTMKAMGHGSAKMMMRYQHPEYVEAARGAINRRNEKEVVKGFGPTFGPTQNEGAPKSA